MSTATKTHPFEAAGLGLAPFKLMGMSEQRGPITLPGGTQVGAPGQPMGSCDYCGQGIAFCFHVRSADGKSFIVGSDCVAKTYREFGTEDRFLSDVEREVKRHRNELARAKREALRLAEAAVVSAALLEARAALDAHPSLFTDAPHPNAALASRGKTQRDYLEFLLSSAGNDRRLQVCREIMLAAGGVS